jgi:hypothetical protein
MELLGAGSRGIAVMVRPIRGQAVRFPSSLARRGESRHGRHGKPRMGIARCEMERQSRPGSLDLGGACHVHHAWARHGRLGDPGIA